MTIIHNHVYYNTHIQSWGETVLKIFINLIQYSSCIRNNYLACMIFPQHADLHKHNYYCTVFLCLEIVIAITAHFDLRFHTASLIT